MAVADTNISIFDQARVPLSKLRSMLLAMMRGQGNYAGTSTGAATYYNLTLLNVPTSYETPFVFTFLAHQSNSGTAYVNVNGLGSRTIKQLNGSNLAANMIIGGMPCQIFIGASNAYLMNPQGVTTDYGSFSPATLTGTGTLSFSGGGYGGVFYEIGCLRFFSILISGVTVSGTGTRVFTSIGATPTRRCSFPAHIFNTSYWEPALAFNETGNANIAIDLTLLSPMPIGSIWFEVTGFHWRL